MDVAGAHELNDRAHETTPLARMVVEIRVTWRGDVLRVDRLEPPRSYILGGEAADFAISGDVLGSHRWEAVSARDGMVVVHVPSGMTGTLTRPDADVTPIVDSGAARDLPLGEGASVHLDLLGGSFALDVGVARREPRTLRACFDRAVVVPVAASLALHLSALVAFVPLGARGHADDDTEKPDIAFLQRMLQAAQGQGDPGDLGPRQEGAAFDEVAAAGAEAIARDIPPTPRASAPAPSPDGGAPDAGRSARGGVTTSDAGLLENPFRPGEEWTGTYRCAQGLTSLVLRIDSVESNHVRARFDFNYVAGGADGSYYLTGTFNPATHAMTFVPGEWISKPGPSWFTVGMNGFVDDLAREYTGRIPAAGCGAFSVVR
jgi:hypothetical protein